MTEVNTTDQAANAPRTIGPYRIEKELGAGAMGTVYLAMHTGLDRAVALKLLRADTLETVDATRRFLREARAVARLEHPNIVGVYDAGEIDGMYYIAMKLLSGTNLQALLADGPLPLDRAAYIGMQLASALDYAHQRDVVHLDVKPANVMIADRDLVTLTDFGIAQALHPGATRSATITGTPLYMSPEQIQGHDLDRRSDIYSLGIMLYEMCSGKPPFEGQFVTVMYAHLHTPLPDLHMQRGDVPEELAAIIDRATKKDPAERYQTAGDIARALQPFIDSEQRAGEGTVALGTLGKEQRQFARSVTRREGTSRTRYIAAGGAAAVLCVAVAGIALLRGGGSSTGALALTSQPSGLHVSVDGKLRGTTPLHLSGLAAGKHSVTLRGATYEPKTVTVSVIKGKTYGATVSMASLPAHQLVTVPQAVLTSYLQRTSTGFSVGPALTSVPAAKLYSTHIWAAAEYALKSSYRGVRDVALSPTVVLSDPNNAEIGTLTSGTVTVPKNGSTRATAVAIRIGHLSGNALPKTGTWTVRIALGGHTMRTLTFKVTR